MGIFSDDVVLIQPGKSPTEPRVVTVNCPDKPGLGCDLCRIVLEFGLCIVRGVLWVVPHMSSYRVDWESLKNRLLSVCPSCMGSYYLSIVKTRPSNSSQPSLYLLKYCCIDRKGLLHDVTKILSELEFTIQRVKVMTTPDGRVVDLFFITDEITTKGSPYLNNDFLSCFPQVEEWCPHGSLMVVVLLSGQRRELLHTKKRRDDTCKHLFTILGEYSISCELQLAGPEYKSLQGFSSLPPVVAEELFGCELPDKEACSQELSTHATALSNASITVDNLLSPAHTLLQIKCADQKSLIYDILRTSKDLNIQIAYGRFSESVKGYQNLDLFIQQPDGNKIVDPKQQTALCSHLKEEMLHPLRVIVTNRGPDIELLVANPVELSGKGRPRVFYDVTLALKMLGICIFSAEIGRHSTSDRQWEVYRFLLNESPEFPLSSSQARNQIVERALKLCNLDVYVDFQFLNMYAWFRACNYVVLLLE
ncbi:hypothetical protein JRO89_XS14G0061700 [Xanthoceras sorbifolium]|uniref:ACT domain-containing protein ACR n=1 Tax=Xanthoceras sorbifolium TaxID=99658 RepID=A0ABQ8H434_9ROSI|nr:hypothetical protein JRO89_XS14G0061700 [Xanthoceras sorbifolium]